MNVLCVSAWVSACMGCVCAHIWMCVQIYVYACAYTRMQVYTRVSALWHKCVDIYICYQFVCVNFPSLSVYGCMLQRFQTSSYDPNSVVEDLDYAHYGLDTLAI